ncbi:LacI family DNA-binding transcriptional regulator [Marinomonas sp. GJ51-6]|uniref:LacI family DNA-binding transcriptional regulator n=1 Tax=Marinomonas sp. GJ51-6 TaxID=2992802 RepID=UPI0029349291|nr:LacI family DNA-binding transcriptional regulator [Marinomonas sp. GJ51-6]WOD07501.1 LacI family DNA-binding transcriptional regulator [Marinomonas sp. GJ51-6]
MNSPFPKQKASVRSLAEATGLSVATISRVLNNADNVSDKTRERVLSALKEHGYVMNSAARALSTRRTRTIGAVVPTLAYSIFAKFLNTLESKLAELGYALVVATSGGDLEIEEKRAKELLDLGTEGLILTGSNHNDALLQMMQERAIPFIFTSVHDTEEGFPSIGYDNSTLAKTAIQYLYTMGHHNIAVVHGDINTNDRVALRIKGVEEKAKQLGITVSYIQVSLDVAGGVVAAKEYMKSNTSASACLCLSDILALGMIFEFNRCQLTVPDDVSLMGFDDFDWAEHCFPALTTIGLPTVLMGEKTAQAMGRCLDDKQNISNIQLEARIIERDSVKKR